MIGTEVHSGLKSIAELMLYELSTHKDFRSIDLIRIARIFYPRCKADIPEDAPILKTYMSFSCSDKEWPPSKDEYRLLFLGNIYGDGSFDRCGENETTKYSSTLT